MRKAAFAVVALALCMGSASGQGTASAPAEEIEAIKAACMDYVQGFFQGNVARIERGVYKDLVKRQPAGSTVSTMDRKTLIGYASTKRTEPQITVEVLDVYQNIAVAKVVSAYVDYCQLAKLSGAWQVVNVLWVNK